MDLLEKRNQLELIAVITIFVKLTCQINFNIS